MCKADSLQLYVKSEAFWFVLVFLISKKTLAPRNTLRFLSDAMVKTLDVLAWC